jgi:hypothetical protein
VKCSLNARTKMTVIVGKVFMYVCMYVCLFVCVFVCSRLPL